MSAALGRAGARTRSGFNVLSFSGTGKKFPLSSAAAVLESNHHGGPEENCDTDLPIKPLSIFWSRGNEGGRVYNSEADDVIQIWDISYALGEELGAGAFGTVHKVELLIPALTELALDEEGGRAIRDEDINIVVRVAPDREESEVDLNVLVGSGCWYALKIVRLPADSAKAAVAAQYKALHEYEAFLLGQLGELPHVVAIEDFETREAEVLVLLELAQCDLTAWLFPPRAIVENSAGDQDGEHVDHGDTGDVASVGTEVPTDAPANRNPMRSLSPFEILGIWTQLVEALKSIHDIGIIHFDIKPKNILVFDGKGPAGSPILLKLADFGLARQLQGSQTHISASGGWGTLKYMAPEVVHQPDESFEFRNVGSVSAGRVVLYKGHGVRVIIYHLACV